MIIKIKNVEPSAKKGKIKVNYKVNGMARNTLISKKEKNIEKAIIALESDSKKK